MTELPDDAPAPPDAADPGSDAPSADGETATPAAKPERPKRPLFKRRPKADAPPSDSPDADAAAQAPTDVAADADQPTEVVEMPPRPPLNPGRLRRERKGLVARRQEAVYHLGGLAFELFRRDMLTEPVMRRRADEVADIDRSVIAIDEELATLEETRRTRREERAAERREARARQKQPSGYCLSCGKPYRDVVNFCGNCGSPIVHETLVEESAEQPTSVVETPAGSGSTEVITTAPPEEAPRA
jgi:hypothetical protein